jgi:3-hydroxybutyryl-CoA dehydrogenase
MPGPLEPPAQLFVLGAGIMGSGIAGQAALAGHPVILYDIEIRLAERGRERAAHDLERHCVREGRPGTEAREAADRISTTSELDGLAGSSLVLEAAPESLELKRRLFQEMDRRAPAQALLASNTSSLSITALAAVTKRPERVVGIHFFNPVLRMPLVEIIAGVRTSGETVQRARAFAEGLGKTVTLSQDAPGFVTSRSMAVLVNEAIWMLYDRVATREDIDRAHKLGFHHPMGPLELADLVGLDTLLHVLDRLYTGFRDPKYRACPLLVNLVEAGKLGRKTGEGFYTYPAPPASLGGAA